MTAVLGTSISIGAAVSRAVLISDLHLSPADVRGPQASSVSRALDAAIEAAVELGSDGALFVLGDLFDSYVTKSQVRESIWRDVAERFRAAAARGLRVVLLVGNRDFLLGDEFARAARCELLSGGCLVRLGGVATLLLHGDELCQNDIPYQRAKRWLRSRAVRLLARRLPLSLARRAAERARRKSQSVVQSGDQTRFLPSERAVAAAFAGTGARQLVFGHIHRLAAGEFASGGVGQPVDQPGDQPGGSARYFVLPAFDQAGMGARADSAGISACAFGAAVTADAGSAEACAPPPPCPWSV
ncbi:MAG: UDP-2,3-diacylglucosamine diphosphatase [Planctomycetota bacterium]